jgi:Uma2 family endonuclease
MATSVLHGSVAEPEVALRKFTIGEYHKLGDAGILRANDRVELIDGLLIQKAPIGPEHQFILETLNDIFGRQKKGRFKVGPGRPIPIPDFDEPQPDMVLFKTEGGTRRQHASPQEIYLVVEVSDTTVKYDSGKKASRLRERGNSGILDRRYSGQSHQSIPAKPKKEVPRKPLHGRFDRGTSVFGCFGPTGRCFLSFSAIAGNVEPAFQFAVTKLGDSNRAVFSHTLNPAPLK